MLLLVLALAYFAATASGKTIGDAMGVQLHMTSRNFSDGELVQLQQSFSWVRQGLVWLTIESHGKGCGTYHFEYYDSVVANLSAAGVPVYLTLSGASNCWNYGKPPNTTAGRDDYAHVAALAATRYYPFLGLELWNEPEQR